MIVGSSTDGLAQGFRVIHSCSLADEGPHTLIQNPNDGLFYGVTQSGGTHRPFGSVIKVDSSGTVTTLHSFAGPPDDGRSPQTALFFDVDGLLYGTTAAGGTDDAGTIFRIDTSGGSYAIISQSAPGLCEPNGSDPSGSLIKASDGNLYVPMMACGSLNENGTVDYIDAQFNETRVGGFIDVSMENGTVAIPTGHLVEGTDNELYGTATVGAPLTGYYGGVYRMPLGNGAPELVHGFTGQDGLAPMAPLCLASDGFFYGTTFDVTDAQGTTQGTGTIFKVAQDGTFQTVHVFNGADGRHPTTGLMQASDGDLYGVATGGGTAEGGVIYRLDLSGNYSVILNFGDVFGNPGPWSELLQASDGKLYGTTDGAGVGEIFIVDLTQKIDSLSPDSGPAAGGTAFTINGNGFVSGATVNFASNVSVPDPMHIDATTFSGVAGTLQDVRVTLPDTTVITKYKGWMYDFDDVPPGDIFHDFIRAILANGITAGCGGGDYCRNNPVRRDQMAVFIEKAKNGANYVPPKCTGVFPDVPCPGPFTDWVEQLFHDGITGGCGGGNYCPSDPVLRQQMPVFLLKAEHGSSYTPPACTGIFGDVPCPSQFADFIEQLYNENVTGGCSANPLDYCPLSPVLRGQMAVFLVKIFGF